MIFFQTYNRPPANVTQTVLSSSVMIFNGTSIAHFEVIFKGLVYFVNIKLPVSFKAVCAQPST